MAKKPTAPPAWDGTATFLEFATAYPCEASYINELKDAGRLVLTGDGTRVVVVASMKRIQATADPSRGEGGDESSAIRRARAIADKAEYDAETARMELEERRKLLWNREEIRAAAAKLIAATRSSLENLPAIVSAEAAAETDEAKVTLLLRNGVELILGETERQLKTLAEGEAS